MLRLIRYGVSVWTNLAQDGVTWRNVNDRGNDLWVIQSAKCVTSLRDKQLVTKVSDACCSLRTKTRQAMGI